MEVQVVDDTSFAEQLKTNKKVVVKYFAGWCGTCRLFAPKYKRLSKEERFNDIAFLDVDAENSPEARKAANVKNLPTVAIFKDGELVDSVCSGKEDVVVELIEKLNS